MSDKSSKSKTKVVDHLTHFRLISMTFDVDSSTGKIYCDCLNTIELTYVFFNHSFAMATCHTFYYKDLCFLIHFILLFLGFISKYYRVD